MRKCSKCKLEKTESESYKNNNWCRACRKVYHKQNRDKVLGQLKQYYQNNKDKFRIYGIEKYNLIKGKFARNCPKCDRQIIQTTKRMSDLSKKQNLLCRSCISKSIVQPVGNLNWNFKGCGNISTTYFNHVKKSAERRHIQFSITIEDMDVLFTKQNGKCVYTGEQLTIGMGKNKSRFNASLDRIDSSKGYIIDNIQFVTKNINMMKQKFSHNQFTELCNKVSEHMIFNTLVAPVDIFIKTTI